jgi:hypothetical protein
MSALIFDDAPCLPYSCHFVSDRRHRALACVDHLQIAVGIDIGRQSQTKLSQM